MLMRYALLLCYALMPLRDGYAFIHAVCLRRMMLLLPADIFACADFDAALMPLIFFSLPLRYYHAAATLMLMLLRQRHARACRLR